MQKKKINDLETIPTLITNVPKSITDKTNTKVVKIFNKKSYNLIIPTYFIHPRLPTFNEIILYYITELLSGNTMR